MAFSPENKSFKNSAFVLQCRGGRKMRAFLPFSLGDYSCTKEGAGRGEKEVHLEWGGKADPGHHGGFCLSGPKPQVNNHGFSIQKCFTYPSNLCQANGGGRKNTTNKPDSLLLSEPFVLKWDERLLKDINGNLCKHRLKISFVQRVTQTQICVWGF